MQKDAASVTIHRLYTSQTIMVLVVDRPRRPAAAARRRARAAHAAHAAAAAAAAAAARRRCWCASRRRSALTLAGSTTTITHTITPLVAGARPPARVAPRVARARVPPVEGERAAPAHVAVLDAADLAREPGEGAAPPAADDAALGAPRSPDAPSSEVAPTPRAAAAAGRVSTQRCRQERWTGARQRHG